MTPPPPEARTLPPLLVPRPLRLTLHHSGSRAPTPAPAAPATRSDPSLPHPDAYRLTIDPPRITIAHRSPAGLRYAHATLAQLRAQYGDAPPRLEILDYPAIPTRGLMLDVSRDRIPTMPEFARLLPELATLKLNHLQLYTEHTFAYAGHEEVWEGWRPITPVELAQIQGTCDRLGIELAANQNCFGHLSQWLRLPRYAPLAETHGEWIFDRFKRSGPFSLCPGDVGSMALVRDLLAQLLPHFRSSLVNVGCDETYDVGQGRSRGEVERRGKAAVYFDFVDQVFDAVRAHGKRPMFWADVALSHPESASRIADDAIALAWGYEADSDFRRWCETLAGAGKTAWVCPGTSSWRSITGRTSTRRANLHGAAATAADFGLPGYLITDWGDAGHQQAWPIALAAIAEGADQAWNAGRTPEGSGPELDPRAVSLHCFGDTSLSLGHWLDELGDLDLALRPRAGRSWFEGRGSPLHNASVIFADLAEPWASDAIALDARDFHPLIDRVGELRASLDASVARASGLDPLVLAEIHHTLDRAELAVRRAVARRATPRAGNPTLASLLTLARRVQETHALLWPRRSRPGRGLDDSLAHDERLVQEISGLLC